MSSTWGKAVAELEGSPVGGADRFEFAVVVTGQRGQGQDRAEVWSVGDGLVVALADGAGGTVHGARAAEAVIAVAQAEPDPAAWGAALEALDQDATRLDGGQSTAVLLRVDAAGVRGLSVGDSGAWVVDPRGPSVQELTEAQRRKSLLGDGATAVAFAAGPLGEATLLVASDGLLAYAPQAELARLAVKPDLQAAAHRLVDRVRLRSGALPDDVTVVLVRERR